MTIKTSTILLVFLALGCKTLSDEDTSVKTATPASKPQESCGKTWAALTAKGEHLFNFTSDLKQTVNGNEGYGSFSSRLNRSECFKDWTILVYMKADGDLTPYAMLDLYEMEAGYKNGEVLAGSTLKADVVVQLESATSPQVRRLHMFQQPVPYDETLSFDVFKTMPERDIKSPIVELIPKKKESAAKSLQDFLEWGISAYPAQHYMVIVWGHGQGWTAIMPEDGDVVYDIDLLDVADFPKFGGRSSDFENNPDDPFKGRGGGLFFSGKSEDGYLGMSSIRTALKNVVDRKLDGKKIDVYASDAGLLQMVEVASELKETSEYLIGSANIQNFFGLPYRKILRELNTKSGTVEPSDMARMIPALQQASLKQKGEGLQSKIVPTALETFSMSSLSSSAVKTTLEPSLARLGEAMWEYVREKPEIQPLRARNFRYLLQEAPTYQGGASELGLFLGMLDLMLAREADMFDETTPRSAALTKEMEATRKVLLASVMGYAYGSLYKSIESKQNLFAFRAVSMWLPRSIFEYSDRIDDFRRSAFYRKLDRPDGTNPWVDLFDEVFNADEPIIDDYEEG